MIISHAFAQHLRGSFDSNPVAYMARQVFVHQFLCRSVGRSRPSVSQLLEASPRAWDATSLAAAVPAVALARKELLRAQRITWPSCRQNHQQGLGGVHPFLPSHMSRVFSLCCFDCMSGFPKLRRWQSHAYILACISRIAYSMHRHESRDCATTIEPFPE